jgi:toxin ParE1/3/4
MAQVVWAEPALEDLDEIAEYIALDNLNSAQQLVTRVLESVTRLESHPRSGRKVPELKSSRYRELVVGPCRIFYREQKGQVMVLHVMRSERQLRNFILSDREQDD